MAVKYPNRHAIHTALTDVLALSLPYRRCCKSDNVSPIRRDRVHARNPVTATIHGRAYGIPLFLNEVVELIDPEQMTGNMAWADMIPK